MSQRSITSITICLILIMVGFMFVDLNYNLIKPAKGDTIYVGGGGSGNYSTIQEGVDAASSGDTVYVYYGVYVEHVFLNYTIELIGDSYPRIQGGIIFVQATNCVIKGFKHTDGLILVYEDYTVIEHNILSFGNGIFTEKKHGGEIGHITIRNNEIHDSPNGICLRTTTNSMIYNNKIWKCDYGITVVTSDFDSIHNLIIQNNNISNSYNMDIYVWATSGISFSNNIFNGKGISIEYSSNIVFINNSFNNCGAMLTGGLTFDINFIINNFTSNGTGYAIGSRGDCLFNVINSIISNYERGVGIHENHQKNIISNCIFQDNDIAIDTEGGNLDVVNSMIINSSSYDIRLSSDPVWGSVWGSEITMLNTSFNKLKVDISGPNSTLWVRWYMHVNVTDSLGYPVPNANVKVEDNINGTYKKTRQTESYGFVRWITVTEYKQNVSSKIDYTPHKLTAWKDTATGYANPHMDMSKFVNISLHEGMIINSSQGWNLMSTPLILIEIEIQEVLQSLENHFDAVQWYNVTDSNDPWKHFHTSKPPQINDLNEIDHTIGFWIHIIDPAGTILVLNGTRPSTPQYISLNSGWNLVGYPSLSNKNRTEALNNLTFGTHVDAIWTYNAGAQKWEEVGELNYFVMGKGYWIHAKTDCVWEVPL